MTRTASEYADVVDMFRQLQGLDPETAAYLRQRDAICQRCLPLADHVARRYRGRGEAFDDLVQAARLGLVNAVTRFDVDTGKEFLSFAIPTMMGEVRRHFRDRGWALKVPRRMKELQPQLARATARLTQQLGRAATASEIAAHLGVDRELVVDAMVAHTSYTTLSTDAHTEPDDQNRSIGESLGALDPAFDKVLDTETVRPLIAALPERQRTVLTLRFFEDMTQSEIAERVGCSQMHVSRLLAKALHTLRSGAHQSELAAVG